jgi:hypothetical protein
MHPASKHPVANLAADMLLMEDFIREMLLEILHQQPSQIQTAHLTEIYRI